MESTNNGGGTLEKLVAAGGLAAGGLGFLGLLTGGLGGNGGLGGGMFGGGGGLNGLLNLALLNGILGGGNGAAACGSQKDAIIADLSAKLAGMTSEKYADNVGINTYQALLARVDKLDSEDRANFKSIFDELVRQGKEGVRNEEQFKCLSKELDYRFEALRRELLGNDRELAHAIETESERRVNEDRYTREWVECNFVRNKKVIPTEGLCPPVRLADGSASNSPVVTVQLLGGTTTTVTGGTAGA